MKNTLSLVLISMLFISGAYAEGNNEAKKTVTKMEDRAVIFHDFNLNLSVENSEVSASWDRFDKEGFEWFKLVYSTTNTDPVYPDDKSVFIGKKDQTASGFKLDKTSSYHYVRLCAVILNSDYSKDRYCGKTQKITYGATKTEDKKDEKYETPQNTSTKIHKGNTQQCMLMKFTCETGTEYFSDSKGCGCEKIKDVKNEVKKEYIEKKKEEIQDKIQEQKIKVTIRFGEKFKMRMNAMLEEFILKLEAKSFSDEKNIELINTVIGRLEVLGKTDKYVNITSYMILWLKEAKLEYNPELSELEKIFNLD